MEKVCDIIEKSPTGFILCKVIWVIRVFCHCRIDIILRYARTFSVENTNPSDLTHYYCTI